MDPLVYMSASVEIVCLTLGLAWILTWSYGHDITSNALFTRFGETHVSAAFIHAPANYVVTPLLGFVGYLSFMYSYLDMKRVELASNVPDDEPDDSPLKSLKISISQYRVHAVAHLWFVLALICLPLMVVITPDVNADAYVFLFILVMSAYLGVAIANFYEDTGDFDEGWVPVQRIYLTIFATVSFVLTTVYSINLGYFDATGVGAFIPGSVLFVFGTPVSNTVFSSHAVFTVVCFFVIAIFRNDLVQLFGGDANDPSKWLSFGYSL
jgi:hypothetical protein